MEKPEESVSTQEPSEEGRASEAERAHKRSSIGARAVSGAAWTILTGVGSRGLGLVGTVVLTYFLARDVIGEVSDASIVTLLASQFTTVGVGQYLVANPKAGRDMTWHATVFHQLIGWVALGLCVACMHPLAVWMKAPSVVEYIPGLALAVFIDRITFIPERLLARDMRFRVIGIQRTAGELSYTISSVGLAVLGWGGMSIVIGNVLRAVARLVVTLWATKSAEWLTPAPFSMESMRKMMGFGIPISIGASAGFAARRFDNALISSLFGAEVVGMYNLAYNVADVPAVQVGEQIGDVLLPSFAHMDEAQRKDALVRSTGLLGLVVFPLAVGLGAIAPTLVHALLRAEWAGVGPMLSALAALSVVRPVGWTITSYLQARDQPRAIMFLELFKLGGICVLILSLGRLGPIWACVGVGVAFAAHSVASMWVVRRLDGIPFWGLLGRSIPPLVACLPIVGGVLGVRYVLHHAGLESRFGDLVLEIVVGAAAYVGSALLVARRASADFLNLLRNAIKRRRGKA